jgi:hypothetical protein
VPTFALYQMALGGETTENIADWYGVPESTVIRSIEFEGRLRLAA